MGRMLLSSGEDKALVFGQSLIETITAVVEILQLMDVLDVVDGHKSGHFSSGLLGKK